jgi:LysM repeat protein
MKRYLILAIGLFFLTSCSIKKNNVKAVDRNTNNNQPIKVIRENTLTNKYSTNDYIERFKEIAVEEMNKNGIPASITLAQGLLESGNGNSTLARDANNHFGIKCNIDWKGKTILQDDDQKDDCFRVYNNPEESYKDHSEFLKRKRYASLFELDRNDYKGWAYGLKQAGYATNPKYPELLIGLIERYGLDRFDREETVIAKIKREDRVLTEIAQEIPQEGSKEAEKPPVALKIYEVKQGDTLYSISRRFGLTIDEVRILNGIDGTDLKLGQLLLVSK